MPNYARTFLIIGVAVAFASVFLALVELTSNALWIAGLIVGLLIVISAMELTVIARVRRSLPDEPGLASPRSRARPVLEGAALILVGVAGPFIAPSRAWFVGAVVAVVAAITIVEMRASLRDGRRGTREMSQ